MGAWGLWISGPRNYCCSCGRQINGKLSQTKTKYFDLGMSKLPNVSIFLNIFQNFLFRKKKRKKRKSDDFSEWYRMKTDFEILELPVTLKFQFSTTPIVDFDLCFIQERLPPAAHAGKESFFCWINTTTSFSTLGNFSES